MSMEHPEKQKNAVKSVVDQVMDGIISQIIDGTLHPGDKLPTEMELCKQFGAGRNSVREAVKKLQAYGILYIKRADGTFVSENYNQKMLDPMLYSIILQKNSWQEFVELRSVPAGSVPHLRRAFCRNALAGAFGGQGAGTGQPVPHPDRQCGPEPHAGHHH
mgnify:CR=1 FL=1